MRVKICVRGDEMSVMDVQIGEARRMSDYVLARKFRGPGDTIERAAYEAETTWGVPASILMRLRHRHEIKDMLLSNWVALVTAYDAAVSQVDRAAEHQRDLAKAAGRDDSSLYKMAALLACPKDGAPE